MSVLEEKKRNAKTNTIAEVETITTKNEHKRNITSTSKIMITEDKDSNRAKPANPTVREAVDEVDPEIDRNMFNQRLRKDRLKNTIPSTASPFDDRETLQEPAGSEDRNENGHWAKETTMKALTEVFTEAEAEEKNGNETAEVTHLVRPLPYQATLLTLDIRQLPSQRKKVPQCSL